MLLAHRLAAFAAAPHTLPERTRAAARCVILDLLTAAAAGHGTTGARAARHAARESWGPGAAAVWFTDLRLSGPGAAFANAAAASMLDLDDGHRAAAGHPGAAIIPAVIAECDRRRPDVEALMRALAVGYEVAVRISAARDFSKLATMASGLWCGQGVAAAVGALRGLPPDTIAHAVAIAGTVAPALAPVGYTRFMGNHVKEGIPAATANGMIAVDLAQAGFAGPLDLLDDPGYDPAVLREGLGERWMIEGVYFKPYSCCRWAHAAVEAALGLQARHGFAADDIVRLDIATFGRALSLNNEIAPRSLESAQYSVPFCVALALVRGPDALLPMLDAALADAAAIGLAGRIALAVDPALDAMFSAAVPARVTVATRTGRFTTTVTAPRGEPANPMSWDDLARKARVATRALADPGFVDRAVASVRSLGEGRLEPLLGVLRTRFDESPAAASAAC